MKNKIQIVNDNDQIIGYKNREEVDYSQDIYRSVGLWIINSRGEVLLAQRKFTKDKDPGKWGPAVAGTVEEGETYETNIYKEAQEEIGISGVSFDIGPKQRLYAPRHQFCQWYTVVLDTPIEDFTIQEEEVEQLLWMPLAQLVEEVKTTPEKYVPAMSGALELLHPES